MGQKLVWRGSNMELRTMYPIPRPFKKIRTTNELHEEMKATHVADSTFFYFKRCVRVKSTALNLNRRDRLSTPRRWNRLVKEVTELEPTLCQYEDQWPITVYHDLYIKEYLKKLEATPTKPKEVIELTSRENSPSQLELSPSRSSLSIPKDRVTNAVLSNLAHSACSEHTVVAVCYQCPSFFETFEDITISSRNNRLKQLFNDSDILEALRQYGICFDQHLDYFIHHLDNTSRLAALDCVPSYILGTSARSRLLQILKDYSVQFSRVVRENTNQEDIPWPSWTIQEEMVRLMDPDKFNNWFQRVMLLENEHALFFELLDAMDKFSVKLHQIMYPVVEHLRATIRLIINKHPLQFRKYTNYWPIQLYIKRRRLLTGCTAPQYTPHEEEQAFIYVFDEDLSPDVVASRLRSRRGVSIEQAPCKHHPSVDISGVTATYRMFLQRLGIAELLPALVLMGLHTNADVDNFCRLGLAERSQALVDAAVGLCGLQRFMLDMLCIQWRRHFLVRSGATLLKCTPCQMSP